MWESKPVYNDNYTRLKPNNLSSSLLLYRHQWINTSQLLAGRLRKPSQSLTNPLSPPTGGSTKLGYECKFSNRFETECFQRFLRCQNSHMYRHEYMRFHNKTTLRTKMPRITEMAYELPRLRNCEWQPELVEFDDGASNVPFTTVPFLPELHAPK